MRISRTGRWPVSAIAAMVVAGRAVASGALLEAQPVAAGLNQPLFVTSAPGDRTADPTRIFILERPGRIRIARNGAVLAQPFLDITSKVQMSAEGGLLGLAFAPDYPQSGRFFISYTRYLSGTFFLESVIAEHHVSADPDVADPAPVRELLKVTQPASNHNGGWIGFSPVDGYLYIPLGDGGVDGPMHAQTIEGDLLGAILRIDVDGDDFPGDPDRNYRIPPDNPLVGAPGDDEIFAWGLRNPYRCAFDSLTGDLWLADVGEATEEEIDVLPAGDAGGENFGWGCVEGLFCTGDPSCVCGDPSLTRPIFRYVHAGFDCAIIGGAVYRGCAIPALDGAYFYGDFCSGRVWSIRYDGEQAYGLAEHTDELDPSGDMIRFIIGFGTDALGELYLCDMDGGEVFKIAPTVAPPDEDGDGIPDACEPAGDVDGDNDVDFQDLLAVLSAWGPCAKCAEDLDGSGVVDFADVLIVLSGWT